MINLMRKFIILFILLLFLQPVYSADIQLYSLSFKIQQDLTVEEELKIIFSEPLNQTTLNYLIVGEFSDLKINNTLSILNYYIENVDGKYNIKFFIPNGTQQIYISFKPENIVSSNNGINEFFTSLQPPPAKRIHIDVWLPEGYAIYNNIFIPSYGEKKTDGKNIYVSWRFDDEKEEIPLLIRFYNPTQKTQTFVFITLVAVAILLPISILLFRRRIKEEFFKGFSEDERKTIEILMKRKFVYQNKLEKELHFSRAKMTRIMKKLEEKNLVKREKSGRTNKIIWK